jgi:hypothetical protein
MEQGVLRRNWEIEIKNMESEPGIVLTKFRMTFSEETDNRLSVILQKHIPGVR